MKKSSIWVILFAWIYLLSSCSQSSSTDDNISPVITNIEDMNWSPVQDMDMWDTMVNPVDGGR